MSEKLPETLSPFFTNHPASSAYRITLSPHEWEWTQEEQEALARTVVKLDSMRAEAEHHLQALYSHVKRSCHSEVLAGKAIKALGFKPRK